MKGLMLKEFLYLRRQSKSLLLVLCFFLAFFLLMAGANGKENGLQEAVAGLMVALPVMLTILLTINATAFDERAHWDSYVLSLPVSRNRIVAARYLSAALLSLAGTVLSFLIGLPLLGGTLSAHDLILMVAASFAFPLFICSVLFPLFFRFGLQKARFAIVVIFLLPTAVELLAKRFGFAVSEGQAEFFCKLSPVLVLAMIVASYFISCAVYRRKQG